MCIWMLAKVFDTCIILCTYPNFLRQNYVTGGKWNLNINYKPPRITGIHFINFFLKLYLIPLRSQISFPREVCAWRQPKNTYFFCLFLFYFFWKEIGVPGENLCKQEENIQTPQNDLRPSPGIEPRTFCCEVAPLSCH